MLPLNLDSLFTPLTIAFLIMGDGSWDNSGSRIVLHLNNISSYLVKTPHSDEDRGYVLKINFFLRGP